MPSCFGASGSVRTSANIQSASRAFDVQIFWPLTTQWSPSSTAARAQRREVAARRRARCSPGTSVICAEERAADEVLLLRLGAVLEQRRARACSGPGR